MFPFVSNFLRSDLPLFLFEDIFVPGPGIRVGVPRPPYTNQQFRDVAPKQPNLQKMQSIKKSIKDYTESQGQYWGILGDQAFEKEDYGTAISHYTKAIELTEGTESSFFRNRGLAFKKAGSLDPALRDAIMAVELDDKNIKAHLLCGQVLAEKGKKANTTQDIETAIIRLTKARTLCAGQKKQYYEDELSKYIYRAKKLLWYKTQEIQNNQKKLAIENYRKFVQSREDLTPEQKNSEIELFNNLIGDPNKKQSYDIPSHLICKITFELMENPVVTDAGHTYERDMLIEALQKNGPIDPVTRAPIRREFYPNHNVKQATQDFLLNNPWAFEFSQGENPMDIEF